MSENYTDGELIRLTAEATALDDQLARLQPEANGSLIGSTERQRYSELRGMSAAAWQLVLDRVMQLKGLTDDLRQPLPEEECQP